MGLMSFYCQKKKVSRFKVDIYVFVYLNMMVKGD